MHKSRHIQVPAKEGGTACEGAMKTIASCNMQACAAGNNNCEYLPWTEWSACDKCGGQRKRRRHLQPPVNGGTPCTQDSLEEVQGCSRNCHNGKFCAWAEWAPWSTCSVTCGNGKVSRTRSLAISDFQPSPPIPTQAVWNQKYEALNLEMMARQDTNKQDMFFAFTGGCLSFLTLASAIRICTRSRRPSESYAQVSSTSLE